MRSSLWRNTVIITVHLRHIIFVVFVVVSVTVYGLLSWRALRTTAPVAEGDGRRIVAIDAGHGGPDPGAIGVSGSREKDITLAIALKVEQVLKHAGIETVMTRTGDYDLVRGEDVPHRQREDLTRRAALVNRSGAQLFVSLHANSFPSASWFGAQTFHLEDDEDGFRLASHVQAALVRELREVGPNRRRAAAADLRILRDVNVPAVVIEVGFLSHPEEESLLQQSEYQGRVAQAIANGILSFIAEQERHRGAGNERPQFEL